MQIVSSNIWVTVGSNVLSGEQRIHVLPKKNQMYTPAGIFDVDSTLNRRRNFDGRRKRVEISTVVEISTLIRRRIDGRQKSVEKRKNISTSKFARWDCKNGD